MTVVLTIVFVGAILLGFMKAFADQKAGKPQARAAAKRAQEARIVCPHCQTAGRVTTRPVKLKKGISGGKATGAILTGGVSMLATGLSRKESVTAFACSNCGVNWHA